MFAAGTGAAIVGSGIIMPIKPALAMPAFTLGPAVVSFPGPARFTINGVDMFGLPVTEFGSVGSVGALQTKTLFSKIISVQFNTYASQDVNPTIRFDGQLGVVSTIYDGGVSAIAGMTNEEVRQMSLTGVLPCGLNIQDMQATTRSGRSFLDA